MTQTLHFTTTINAPVSRVRSLMLNHPSYEMWTKAFSEWSTYTGSREQWSEIRFHDETWQGMIAKIAESRLHEYVSIQHLWEIGKDNQTTMYEKTSFENYTFTDIGGDATKVDVEMTAMPDEWVDMFNVMWPKALELLKGICEGEVVKLTVTTDINAPLEKVRDYRNNPTHIVNRCFASDDRCCPRSSNDLQVWGLMVTRMEAKDGSFWFDMTGKYDVVEPMSRVMYTMGEMKEYFLPAGRQVEVLFEEVHPDKGGAEGGGFQTRITEHFDAETIHSLEMQVAWWQSILENFKKYVETA